TVDHLLSHDVADLRGPRVTSLGDRANGDVTVGHHAGETIVIADRNGPHVEIFHLTGRLLERVVRADALNTRGHDVFDLHRRHPASDWSLALLVEFLLVALLLTRRDSSRVDVNVL